MYECIKEYDHNEVHHSSIAATIAPNSCLSAVRTLLSGLVLLSPRVASSCCMVQIGAPQSLLVLLAKSDTVLNVVKYCFAKSFVRQLGSKPLMVPRSSGACLSASNIA